MPPANQPWSSALFTAQRDTEFDLHLIGDGIGALEAAGANFVVKTFDDRGTFEHPALESERHHDILGDAFQRQLAERLKLTGAGFAHTG